MPNWCGNVIDINGSAEDIAALYKLVGDKFDFNGLIPCPDEIPKGNHGRSAGDTIVVVNKRSGIFHDIYDKCMKTTGKGFDSMWKLKQAGGHTAADAINNGYRACKNCMVAPRMKKQDFDQPLEEGAALVKKYGYDNWYDWNIANWGTKWNACDCEADFGDTFASIVFQTAWSPPEPVYNKLVELFSNLNVRWSYQEEGNGFSGSFGEE